MPFLLNVLYDSGLGPITLDPAYFGAPPTPVYPQIWYAVTGVVAVGAVLIGSILVLTLIRFRRHSFVARSNACDPVRRCVTPVPCRFRDCIQPPSGGGTFRPACPDHLISALSVAWVHLRGCRASTGEKRKLRLLIPVIAVAVLIAFCVCRDTRLHGVESNSMGHGENTSEQGVRSLAIVGGFEFNAWNNYDKFVPGETSNAFTTGGMTGRIT